MRAVIQRVTEAAVSVEGRVCGAIGPGLLVLLGIHREDTNEDVRWLCERLPRMRLFDDAQGRMNQSVVEMGGGLLVISQFTLYGSTRKGTRPSWSDAARPEVALPLYQEACLQLAALLGRPVATGEFGAHMRVSLVNDGPVTVVIDSRLRE